MYKEYETLENLRITGEFYDDCEFIDCRFINCTFEECSLENCSFSNCSFTDCNIVNLRCNHSTINNLEFHKCNLIGIHWYDLMAEGKVLEPFSVVESCMVKYNNFYKMSLVKFDFNDDIMQECIFEDCDLRNSSFNRNNLESTQFMNCNLINADFRNAMGYQIDIESNKIKGAKFSFPEVVSLLSSLGIQID